MGGLSVSECEGTRNEKSRKREWMGVWILAL